MAETQHRWILGGCPRCNGDLYPEDGGHICLQCGYIDFPQIIEPLPLVVVSKNGEPHKSYGARLFGNRIK